MSNRPLLSLLIPTAGRETLIRCLKSIQEQEAAPSYECIVIGDTHEGPLPQVQELVESLGPQFRYLEHDAGMHDFGHSQLNYGDTKARGEWLHHQDDDDIYAPGALEAIGQAIAALVEPKPLLFRFKSWYGPVFWAQRGVIAESLIGGHCIVTPNIPDRVGMFGHRYEGDLDYIVSTLDLWPNGQLDAVWIDHVICIARP